jgi:hypothetical protein
LQLELFAVPLRFPQKAADEKRPSPLLDLSPDLIM